MELGRWKAPRTGCLERLPYVSSSFAGGQLETESHKRY